ncbi:MAG: hypothetical protein M1503_03545 [Thaumarchaeota archaeon]|nr:hypothetical protein [Nitrososphaerota archaeon]MCL5317327.1 hypothetical protein [Nitrososphaerota archaeon]
MSTQIDWQHRKKIVDLVPMGGKEQQPRIQLELQLGKYFDPPFLPIPEKAGPLFGVLKLGRFPSPSPKSPLRIRVKRNVQSGV